MDSNKTQFTNEAFVPDPELILWKNYSRAGSHYDEAIDENGKFRPLSGEILGYLDSLQPFEYHRYI
ncbi:MAG: hypothetical protein K8R21_05025, partial [Leptospira sp.]|nr:hypothetical protein [Leptospira sp.]